MPLYLSQNTPWRMHTCRFFSSPLVSVTTLPASLPFIWGRLVNLFQEQKIFQLSASYYKLKQYTVKISAPVNTKYLCRASSASVSFHLHLMSCPTANVNKHSRKVNIFLWILNIANQKWVVNKKKWMSSNQNWILFYQLGFTYTV